MAHIHIWNLYFKAVTVKKYLSMKSDLANVRFGVDGKKAACAE